MVRKSAAAIKSVSASAFRAYLWVRVPNLAPILMLALAVVYFTGFSLFRQNWSSLLIFLPVLIVSAWTRRLRDFTLTWIPLTIFLDAFARLRGIADNTRVPIHHTAVLEAEQRLFFGTVPSVWLQDRLTTPKQFHWYDYLATFTHWSHFVAPVAILFTLWLTRPALFRRYLIAFVTLTTLILIGYFLFPAAPPWMAAREGYLPHLARPMVDIAKSVNQNLFGSVYTSIGASNDVAAMPSLHASYPMLLCAMFWGVSRKVALIGLAYSLLMITSLVYLGEHYVTDTLVAALCVVAARGIARAIDARLPALPARRPIRAVTPEEAVAGEYAVGKMHQAARQS